ncbi:hypothetical protein SG34_026490 [Thalassomonas viridans]|uniref:Prokaryotic phospholipase A2 n=1 Tax=Thalassomonas viridans TaxID=137584 RepID=A0AAE9Z2G7_9GAMM|nr:hypothetical protein [Thalassomonas viridans]WDE04819.1 hypothetical protein SG34_026490 [Thalassomonas viridans]
MNKTIKTSTKVLSNTVLAAALMMGNVNVQTSQDYYEDKEGFHQVSTSMENGWGWSLGFNKANANTCSNNLITNCEVGEGEDTTEHIPVVGQRPPTEPWQGVPDESTEDYGSTGGGSGGSGSAPSQKERECQLIIGNRPSGCSLTQIPDLSANGCSTPLHVPFWNDYFRNSCNAHDICYSAAGSVRSDCDSMFKREMDIQCIRENESGFQQQCLAAAWDYYNGVNIGGGMFFNNAQVDRKCFDWHTEKNSNGC